jgi:von Willebrand factor type A C-terminal domain
MTSLPGFTVDIDHNPYLPAGGGDVSAVVTVTAGASDDTPPEPGAAGASAEIIIVDCSGSMRSKRKIGRACAATEAALDVLSDGVWFAIIAGDGNARRVYPRNGTMAVAGDRTRTEVTVRFVMQVAPAIDDLTGRRVTTGAQAGDYPTGAWAPGESRDYHVGVQVNAASVGAEMLAARVSLVASSADGQQVLGQGLIKATWTEDEALSTRISPGVAHYTGQAELADAIQEGLEARQQGDEDRATSKLGRAVALAHQAGNEDTARLLAKVVDVMDEATGTVRLKKKVDAADEMALDTRSTKTVRVKKELP